MPNLKSVNTPAGRRRVRHLQVIEDGAEDIEDTDLDHLFRQARRRDAGRVQAPAGSPPGSSSARTLDEAPDGGSCVDDHKEPDRDVKSPHPHMALFGLFDGNVFGERQMRLQARIMGSMWLTGAAIGVCSLLLPGPEGVNATLALALTLLAAALGATVLLVGQRLGDRWYQLLVVVGTTMTTAGIYLSHGGAMSVGIAAMYVWVGIYAAYFFSRTAVAAHLAFICVAFSAVIAVSWSTLSISIAIIVISTVVLSTVVVTRLKSELRRIALTDPLTRLPNRQALEHILEREVARIIRFGGSLCVGVIDLDGFKSVNDTEGHLAGDIILRNMAIRWQSALRKIDILARYGGDEFVVVLPSCDQRNAIEIFGRLRGYGNIGWSVGIAEWTPGDSSLELLHKADKALLEAKENGRSCIVCG